MITMVGDHGYDLRIMMKGATAGGLPALAWGHPGCGSNAQFTLTVVAVDAFSCTPPSVPEGAKLDLKVVPPEDIPVFLPRKQR